MHLICFYEIYTIIIIPSIVLTVNSFLCIPKIFIFEADSPSPSIRHDILNEQGVFLFFYFNPHRNLFTLLRFCLNSKNKIYKMKNPNNRKDNSCYGYTSHHDKTYQHRQCHKEHDPDLCPPCHPLSFYIRFQIILV